MVRIENIEFDIYGYDSSAEDEEILEIVALASSDLVMRALRFDIVIAILNGLLAISSLLVFVVTTCKKREFFNMLSLLLIITASSTLFGLACTGPLM